MIPATKDTIKLVKDAKCKVHLHFNDGEVNESAIEPRHVAWEDKSIIGFTLPDNHTLSESEERMNDNVNHPEHYQSDSGIECIDAIKAALTPDEFRGYCKGNAIKYAWRERLKGGDESLQKAIWYMDKAVEVSTND